MYEFGMVLGNTKTIDFSTGLPENSWQRSWTFVFVTCNTVG